MHEMTLTESVVRILEGEAARHGFSRVKLVRLEIGELSHVDPESILFCFGAVAGRSPLTSGAEMKIVRAPGQAHCLDCGDTVPLADRLAPCPRCGGARLVITGGEEMRVKEMEVE